MLGDSILNCKTSTNFLFVYETATCLCYNNSQVYLTIYHDEIGLPGRPCAGQTEGRLSCLRVKLFADGSLGGETAGIHALTKT